MRVRDRIAAWLPAALWAGLVFVASSVPGTDLPGPTIPGFDKVVHAGVYAVLGGLIFRALRRSSRLTPMSAAALALAVTTLYGISDEIHQAFTPHRTPDWRDVVADAAGALLGAALMLSAPWMKSRASSMMGSGKD